MIGYRKLKLFLFVLLALVLVTISGYFFAQKKSVPEFRNKVERIMFEKKNKAPKYILTLSDKENKIQNSASSEQDTKPKVKLETISDFVNAAPLIAKLKEFKNHYSLNNIEVNPKLLENKDSLFLPKISDNNQKPWIEYGQQISVAPNFYKIAVIFKNMGIDQNSFNSINSALPSEVSFSFSPYALNKKDLILQARKKGHETYMDLLLASKDVLKADNGPLAMAITASPQENMSRFYKSLSVEAPIGGMLVVDGMVDETTSNQIQAYFQELKSRGLLMLDATLGNNVDNIAIDKISKKKADIIINDQLSAENIQKLLNMAEKTARENGQALIVANPKPVVVTAIINWIETFSPQLSYKQMKEQNITSIERPFALVPVSNLVVE